MNNKRLVISSYMILCLVWGILTGSLIPDDRVANPVIALTYFCMVLIAFIFITWVYKFSEVNK